MPTATISVAPAARASRAIDTRAWRRVATPRRVEPVVEPDPARLGQGGPSLAAVARDRDERRQMRRIRPSAGRGPSVALPRQRQRHQAGMPRRRLDDVAVAARLRVGELERAGGLHRARATSRPTRRTPGDDRDRVDPQVSADRRVVDPGALQDGRRPQRARREDDGRRPDGRAGRVALAGRRPRPRRPTARPPSIRTRVTRASATIRAPAARRGREVDPDPRLLRPAPAAERAAAAVAAAGRVPARRGRLPAERAGPAQDDRVLRRDVGRLGDPELRLDGGDVRRPRPRRSRPSRPWSAAHSARTDVGRRDAGRPVDERPATDPGAGQHRDRAVPGREQAVIEVEPVEGVELRARHRRLVDERAGLEDDDRPTGRRQRRRDDPAAGARPDDDGVGVERQRAIGASPRRGGRAYGRIGVRSVVTGGSSGR